MSAGIIKSILEGLKLAPRYLIAIGLVAGFILFSGTKLQQTFGISKLTEDYRAILGILFLSSITLLLVALGSRRIDWIKQFWGEREFNKRIVKRLQGLTEDEKQILRYYVAKNTRANMLRINDGIVQGLVSARIIYQSGSLGNIQEGFAHNISDFVWDYLHINPHTLNGLSDAYRTDQFNRRGY